MVTTTRANRTPPAHRVRVYGRNYDRVIGDIGDYTSSAPGWQKNGVGVYTLVVDEDVREPAPVAALLTNTQTVVPITVHTGDRIWTGRVAHHDLEGPPGRGTVTATCVSDFVWVRAMLGWPVPTASLDAQTATHYVLTGPIETAAKTVLRAAITRLRLPLAVMPDSDHDTSPSDYPPARARFTPLDELLLPALVSTGRILTATLWLPDWPQPPGLTLTRPTIVLDVVPAPDAQHVIWTDNAGILSRHITGTSGEAWRAVIGMKGQDLDRQFTSITDPAMGAALGDYALPELWLDATDVDTAAEGQSRGLAKLRELAGRAAVSIDVGDGLPYTLGEDFDVGSRVRGSTSGVFIEDTVDRVTETDNRRDGVVLTVQIGPSNPDETTDSLVLATVADLSAAIANINRR